MLPVAPLNFRPSAAADSESGSEILRVPDEFSEFDELESEAGRRRHLCSLGLRSLVMRGSFAPAGALL